MFEFNWEPNMLHLSLSFMRLEDNLVAEKLWEGGEIFDVSRIGVYTKHHSCLVGSLKTCLCSIILCLVH